MKVRVVMPIPGVSYGNILWHGAWPMRGGKFPSAHPVGTGAAMDTFRSRGYWASCFPEGDGITFDNKKKQDETECRKDVRECFGWEIEDKP